MRKGGGNCLLSRGGGGIGFKAISTQLRQRHGEYTNIDDQPLKWGGGEGERDTHNWGGGGGNCRQKD